MNQDQRWLLIGTGVLVVAMVLFPPYEVRAAFSYTAVGYGFLFRESGTATVNVSRLIAQVLLVLVVAGLLYAGMRTRPKD
jgi:hypothetical protein